MREPPPIEELPFEVRHTVRISIIPFQYHHYLPTFEAAIAWCEKVIGESSSVKVIDRKTGEVIWRHPKGPVQLE